MEIDWAVPIVAASAATMGLGLWWVRRGKGIGVAFGVEELQDALLALRRESEDKDAVIRGLLGELEDAVKTISALEQEVGQVGVLQTENQALRRKVEKLTAGHGHATSPRLENVTADKRVAELELQLMYGETKKDAQISKLTKKIIALERESEQSKSQSMRRIKSMKHSMKQQQREALENWIFEADETSSL